MAHPTAKYKLKEDFRAPKANFDARAETQAFNNYTAGQEVIGYSNPGSEETGALIIADEEFIIPESKVTKLYDVTDADGNKVEQPVDYSQFPPEIREKLESLKKSSLVHNVVRKSRNSANGLLIGGAIGLAYAVITKKSVWMSVIVGGIIGGCIGNSVKIDLKKMKDINSPKPTTT